MGLCSDPRPAALRHFVFARGTGARWGLAGSGKQLAGL